MTHKVHPKIFRIKGINDWSSRGFYRDPAKYLEEDFRIREFLKKKIGRFGVEKIEIERSLGKLNVIIYSARPGLIIGRRGEGIEQFKKILEEKILKSYKTKEDTAKDSGGKSASLKNGQTLKRKEEIRIEIREVKNPWTSASLIAQWAAQQIEKRVRYRRVLKQALGKISAYKEIKGAKIELSGRLDGNEIARRQWLKIGRLPLQTIRSDIDYARGEAFCTYGVIGIKVWLYKGERFD